MKKLLSLFFALLFVTGCQKMVDCDTDHAKHNAVVYFGFNEYSLTEEAMAKLDAVAHHMMHERQDMLNNDRDHYEYMYVIEGHTDSRGSSKYNMALGAKRAKSVHDYLVSKGINAKKLETVSYGEERPVDPAQNEHAWMKNRRVVIMEK